MEFINLTQHEVNIAGGPTLAPSGIVARVETSIEKINSINGIDLFETVFGEVENLPEPKNNCVYVVSALVRTHNSVAHREDVYSPGRLLRDDAGNVIGCSGLTR